MTPSLYGSDILPRLSLQASLDMDRVMYWNWIFAFGGVVPTGICAAFTIGALVDRGWRRGAVLWSLGLLLLVGLGTASKLAHYTWGVEYGLETFRGASGHALRAAAVYPSFALAILAGSPRSRIVYGFGIACMITGLVIVAAFTTATHTPAEALAGAALGSIAALPLSGRNLKKPAPLDGHIQLAAVACAFALWMTLPPFRYDLEQRVVDLSTWLQQPTAPAR